MKDATIPLPLTQQQSDVQATLERATQLEREILPPGFKFNSESGDLMYESEGAATNESSHNPPIYICSKLIVAACTRDHGNENHGRLLEFNDVDGIRHEWAMPMELLAGDGRGYREELLSKGLTIAPGTKARNLLTQYIQSSRPRIRARCVNRTGWHDKCFVFPDQIIGPRDHERIVLQTLSPHSMPDYKTKGSIESWMTQISSLCAGNSRLVFSVSAAFAPPLLNLLDLENGGFHFRGASTTGKTTALIVAASAWGGEDYIHRWRATSNGLEAISSGHNDALLCLDELQQIDPREAGEVAYMLANGSGKQRSDKQGHSKKRAKWRLLFLSTGEIGLAEHMAAAEKKIRGGQLVRMADIPADTNKFGMFENLHGYPGGALFADTLKEECRKNHGIPARVFIELLAEKRESSMLFVQEHINRFNSFIPVGADAQVRRVGSRFALVAAAGELAISFGITGWHEDEACIAARTCFYSWLEGRGGMGSQEEAAALSQVRHFFAQHGESRFSLWDCDPKNKTINRAGFRKQNDAGEWEYFVFLEVFKNDIAKGFDTSFIEKICLKYALIMADSKGNPTRSERLPDNSSTTCRCYRFTQKVLGDA